MLNGSPFRVDHQIAQVPVLPTPTPNKRPVKRRKSVDMLEIVVYGMRSDKTQDMLVDEIEDLMEDSFGHLDRRTVEYPDTRRAPGRRFVFHRISFDSLDNDEKSKLCVDVDSMVGSAVKTSGLDFRAEWSRGRE